MASNQLLNPKILLKYTITNNLLLEFLNGQCWYLAKSSTDFIQMTIQLLKMKCFKNNIQVL